LAEGADAAVHGDEFAVVIGGGGVERPAECVSAFDFAGIWRMANIV
jgi:hypothetical protein